MSIARTWASALAAVVVAASAFAQTSSHAHHPAPADAAPPAAAQAGALVEAEVRRVDKDAGKVTLKHGPIPNLDMPDMTMVFRVADPAMLDRIKAGDRVRFSADKVGGQYTVTRMESAN